MKELFGHLKSFFSAPSYSRTLALIGLLILLIALPVTVVFLGQKTNIFQRASIIGGTSDCAFAGGGHYCRLRSCYAGDIPTDIDCGTTAICCLRVIPPTPTPRPCGGTCMYGGCPNGNYSGPGGTYCAGSQYLQCCNVPPPTQPPPPDQCGTSGAFCTDSGLCIVANDVQPDPKGGVCGDRSKICCINALPTPTSAPIDCNTYVFPDGQHCKCAGIGNDTQCLNAAFYAKGPTNNCPANTIGCEANAVASNKCDNATQYSKYNGGTKVAGSTQTCPSNQPVCNNNAITPSHPTPCTVYSTTQTKSGDVCTGSQGTGVCMYHTTNNSGWDTVLNNNNSCNVFLTADQCLKNLPNCADAIPGTVGGSDNIKSCQAYVGFAPKCCVYTGQSSSTPPPSGTCKYDSDCPAGQACGASRTCQQADGKACVYDAAGHSGVCRDLAHGYGCYASSDCVSIGFSCCPNSSNNNGGNGQPGGGGNTPTPTAPVCTNGQTTSLTLSLKLEGIGTGTLDNNSPAHPVRTAAYVTVTDENNNKPFNSTTTQFTYTNGVFNSPTITPTLSCGHTYTVTVKLPGYVKASDTVTYATTNKTINLNPIQGDFVANDNHAQLTPDGKLVGDDKITVNDYNLFRDSWCGKGIDPDMAIPFTNNTTTLQIKCRDIINLFDYADGGTNTVDAKTGVDEWSENYNLWARGYFKANGY